MRRRSALRGGSAHSATQSPSPESLPTLLQQQLETVFSGLRDNRLLCLDRRHLQAEGGLRAEKRVGAAVGLAAADGCGDGRDLLGLGLTLRPACFFAHLQTLAESAC